MSLVLTAQRLVAPGKGILAADESTGTIKSRFDAIGVESTEANRRDYREMLFRTKGANEFVSGVILYDETLRQKAADGIPMVKLLQDQGIIPGIKVDGGLQKLEGSPEESITTGLDGLPERLAEYYKLGARFTKWRAVINIGSGLPTDECIEQNAEALALFAMYSQRAGLVPIVEPEVLANGEHSIEACEDASARTLAAVFRRLAYHGVDLTGMLLKPSMITSGLKATDRAPAHVVAVRTINCFLANIPVAMPGIVFLSGGQPDDEATENLNAINLSGQAHHAPWQISFSFGRGLQGAPQKVWSGKPENVEAAQAAFYHRAMVSSAAREGRYAREMEAAVV